MAQVMKPQVPQVVWCLLARSSMDSEDWSITQTFLICIYYLKFNGNSFTLLILSNSDRFIFISVNLSLGLKQLLFKYLLERQISARKGGCSSCDRTLLLSYYNLKMFTGKILRNKPFQLQKEAYLTQPVTSQNPLKRVLSSGQLMQTFASNLEYNFQDDYNQQAEKQSFGKAREYVERSERRMKERINNLERRYNLNNEEFERTIEEKDYVIKMLKEALDEKDRLIEQLKQENSSILSSSRSRMVLQQLQYQQR